MKTALAIAICMIAGVACADPALPSQQDVQAALTRSYGWKPGFGGRVLRVQPSSVPGVAEAIVQMSKDERVRLYITADGQNAFVGEVIPFGPDPYAKAREVLKTADGPSRGGVAGGVTLVVFSDLECPGCREMEPTLDRLAADFPQVRQVFQNFPLPAAMHPWAATAAAWADCVGRNDPKHFWAFAGAVFAAQPEIKPDIAPERLSAVAVSVGADPRSVGACAATEATRARVAASHGLGERLFVHSTPSVYVNGRRLPSDLTYDEIKAVVRFELDHADH